MLKAGVSLKGIVPQMVIAHAIIQHAYGIYPCMITSGNDSKHGKNSKHPKGEALDFRTKDLPLAWKPILITMVKTRLGKEFDVVFESEGLENEHMHVEWDPKDLPIVKEI